MRHQRSASCLDDRSSAPGHSQTEHRHKELFKHLEQVWHRLAADWWLWHSPAVCRYYKRPRKMRLLDMNPNEISPRSSGLTPSKGHWALHRCSCGLVLAFKATFHYVFFLFECKFKHLLHSSLKFRFPARGGWHLRWSVMHSDHAFFSAPVCAVVSIKPEVCCALVG